MQQAQERFQLIEANMKDYCCRDFRSAIVDFVIEPAQNLDGSVRAFLLVEADQLSPIKFCPWCGALLINKPLEIEK